ncbi:hypothetical protein Kfla_4264 [Kribbella flavida DSM 17836]|uniref:Uncharacterized protein n=1 Tax=Kribbella flavida (strain DSM 17836 / JCM 10339 / NBRC 14399) TaxID=479435 RepID=D2PU16_KRIFD|nr:hypothetical protein Kfla_4264 [Kribbella flavida DSM 17836]
MGCREREIGSDVADGGAEMALAVAGPKPAEKH